MTSAAPVATDSPEMPGITATAASCAVRTIVLFTPDAMLDVVRIDRGHDRRGERRDECDESEAEHDRAGQHVAGPHHVGTDARSSNKPIATRIGPSVSCKRGPIFSAARRSGREDEHEDGCGQQRGAGL